MISVVDVWSRSPIGQTLPSINRSASVFHLGAFAAALHVLVGSAAVVSLAWNMAAGVLPPLS